MHACELALHLTQLGLRHGTQDGWQPRDVCLGQHQRKCRVRVRSAFKEIFKGLRHVGLDDHGHALRDDREREAPAPAPTRGREAEARGAQVAERELAAEHELSLVPVKLLNRLAHPL
jgi:hypothetical protein